MTSEPLPTPAPSSPTGYVTLADLTAQWGIAGSTLRSAIRDSDHPRRWLPAPDATLGRALVWHPATLANLKRPTPGRPAGVRETQPRARRTATTTAPPSATGT
ncbi:MAG: hypothetical protein ACOH17_14220 [Cellulomonas sp.]